jgi:hypothetical protein
MKLILCAYPRWWRERYADELVALLETEPLTWRIRANVVASGLHERLRGSDSPQLKVLWAWWVFVVGEMAFQETSEHWQAVVARGERAGKAAALHIVEGAAAVGSVAVVACVVTALLAFRREPRTGPWAALGQPTVVASMGAAAAVAALAAVALEHDFFAASVIGASAVLSLVAWTRAAALAARRREPMMAHSYLALAVTAAMVAMATAAGVWTAFVDSQSPSFVGGAELAVIAAFMLAGTFLAGDGLRSLRA